MSYTYFQNAEWRVDVWPHSEAGGALEAKDGAYQICFDNLANFAGDTLWWHYRITALPYDFDLFCEAFRAAVRVYKRSGITANDLRAAEAQGRACAA